MEPVVNKKPNFSTGKSLIKRVPGWLAVSSTALLTIAGLGLALSACYWGTTIVAEANNVPFWASFYAPETLGIDVGIFFAGGIVMCGAGALFIKSTELLKPNKAVKA
jgi:hypothetical protein